MINLLKKPMDFCFFVHIQDFSRCLGHIFTKYIAQLINYIIFIDTSIWDFFLSPFDIFYMETEKSFSVRKMGMLNFWACYNTTPLPYSEPFTIDSHRQETIRLDNPWFRF